jgi:hypothetical protein
MEATETVIPVPEARIIAANTAAYEIKLLLDMLQRYINEKDGDGTIFPVSRSTFERVEALTDAIAGSLDVDYPDFDKVQAVVYGKNRGLAT